jgi:hypothetical protein
MWLCEGRGAIVRLCFQRQLLLSSSSPVQWLVPAPQLLPEQLWLHGRSVVRLLVLSRGLN